MNITELLHIADELDFLGLQREANTIDKLIEKKAQLLALKEKPMIAQLVKIVMVLEKFKPSDLIKGVDISFPISGTPLFGMTRQRAIEELQKHFNAYIEQYLIPTLNTRYKGTKYETRYRSFIEEVQELSRSLSGLLPAHTEQQSVREALTAIEQVKRTLGKLAVHAKIREEGRSSSNVDIEKTIRQGVKVLSDIEGAIKRFNEDDVEEGIKKLKALFPRSLSPKSSFYSLLCKAYTDGLLPFVGTKEVEEQTIDRMAPDVVSALEKSLAQQKFLVTELTKRQALYDRIESLEERFDVIVKNIHQVDIQTNSPLTRAEYSALESPGKPPDIYNYRNMDRKFNQIEGDINILERWVNNYTQDAILKQRISFGMYISKGTDEKRTQKFIDNNQRNITDLKGEIESDIDRIAGGVKQTQDVQLQHSGYRSSTRDSVIWEEWYDRSISRLIQTLHYTLTPGVRGDETTEQAFDRILKTFQGLLNYDL